MFSRSVGRSQHVNAFARNVISHGIFAETTDFPFV
ncbi:hypothetical protein SAMN05878442_3451 [Vreelandella aquamarina]|nr:hypothetical protein SAMN05878442_3451 [Halomonas meridiana]